MATVRAIVSDAYREIGVIGINDTMDANLAALGLLRFQNQLDAWQAESLTLAVNAQLTFESGDDGRVRAVVLQQNGVNQRARRLD